MVTMMVQRIATEHVARLHSAMDASEARKAMVGLPLNLNLLF
jgi:hypothetical protein